ncbi:MAG: hypothetical protein ACOC93_01390 [Planctomycetota bacterium]
MAVLVITALAAMVAAGIMYRVRALSSAATATEDGEQARAAAMAGIRRVTHLLQAHPHDPSAWTDVPEDLANQLVADTGRARWYFTVWAPREGDDAQVRYGVVDEAAKINLNQASPETLSALGLTPEQVDSLLDYLDADDETRPAGAEQGYYSQLPHPYRIPNARRLGTLDELLVVQAFAAPDVYGEDVNLNGLLDAGEDDGEETFPPDNADGMLDRGIRRWATCRSSSPALGADGTEKLSLNEAEIEELEEEGLGPEAVELIEAYRRDGKSFDHPAELLNMTYRPSKPSPDSDQGPRRERRQEADDEPAESVELSSGVGADELPLVLDRLTTADSLPEGGRGRQGLVNIHTAPADVLAALPGLDESLAGRIADVRSGLAAEEKRTIAWLYARNILDEQAFKEVAPLLTARGWQYRVRVVGFGVPAGRFRVFEAVLDLSGPAPGLVYLRETTRLGVPFSLNPDVEQG